MSSRRLVVGLGNPGESYLRTRHNIGFRVADRLVDLLQLDGMREECGSWVRSRGDWLVCQPRTYMNRSGSAVRCICESHGLSTDAVLLVYDDIHLPLGRLRLRAGGSAAGHRGVESAIAAMQTVALPRLRLGVGAPPPGLGEAGLAEYVLADFLPEEGPVVAQMIERAARATIEWLESGIDAAMRLANAPELPVADPPIAGGAARDLPDGAKNE